MSSYHRSFPVNRFIFFFLLSTGLMVMDHRSSLLDPVRGAASVINITFESVVRFPYNVAALVERYYSDDTLHQELRELERKQAVLETRLQRYEALELENQRLKKLLGSSEGSTEQVLLAEIIKVSREPYNQSIVLNRGTESGVYPGQPVLAPEGVLGQISTVGLNRSVVTLITDPSHGLPVQIQRNQLRTIVQGTGQADRVEVPSLVSRSDIRRGDILVTSGMGGRFPIGYKVAEVIEIVEDSSEPFMKISASTIAKIGLVREALLLWNPDHTERAGYSRPPDPGPDSSQDNE